MADQNGYTTPARTRLRELLDRPGLVSQPTIYDPLGARMAEEIGFEGLSLGGYAMGAHLACSEPILSLDTVAEITRNITRRTSLPLMVDAGTGWGEPVHVMHTTRVLEQAGAAWIHIEDQHYPKRVHYHKGIEHVVDLDEMLMRIEAAVSARSDPNFVIVARTDAIRTDGYDEGIRRAAACIEAGAEAIMIFPSDEDETRRAPQDLPGVPLVYVNSTGNRFGRGVFAHEQLEDWGWSFVNDAITMTNVVAQAMRKYLVTFKETGHPGVDPEEITVVRQELENTIGLEDLYRIEAETVEQGV